MCTENGSRPDLARAERAADMSVTSLERVAAALGHPVEVFTDGAAPESRLAETAELLRLWSQVREPAAAQRILAFVTGVVAEQDQAGDRAGDDGSVRGAEKRPLPKERPEV